jgi:hypothetical protein
MFWILKSRHLQVPLVLSNFTEIDFKFLCMQFFHVSISNHIVYLHLEAFCLVP